MSNYADACARRLKIVNGVRPLDRVIRLDDEAPHYDADPRRVESLVRALGLENCNPKNQTPGTKSPEDLEHGSAHNEVDSIVLHVHNDTLCDATSANAFVEMHPETRAPTWNPNRSRRHRIDHPIQRCARFPNEMDTFEIPPLP